MRVVVRGEEQLDRIGRAFQDAADGGLVDAVVDGLEDVARTLPSRVRDSLGRLPRRGGLAALAQRAVVTVKASRGTDPGVSVTVDSDLDLELIDSGRVVHPVYGNRRVSVTQTVPSRTVSGPLEDDLEPELVDAAERHVDDLARRIERA